MPKSSPKFVLAALLVLLGLLRAQEGWAVAEQGCASPLEPGAYTAAFTQQIVATSAGAGGVVVQTIIDGRADLQISCDGGVTGTFKGSPANTASPEHVMTTFHAAIVLLGEEAKCVQYGEYNLTSGRVTAGDKGAPRIVLNFSAGGGQSDCTGSDALLQLIEGMVKSPGGATSHTWTWQAAEWDPTFAHGQSPFGDPAQESAMSSMAQGGDVSQQQQWLVEKSDEEPAPVVTDLERWYDYIFLEHVPSVLNLYTATIDWQKQEPGGISFLLDGQPLESEPLAGTSNRASAEVQIDLLDAGPHMLTVVATSAKGKASAPYQQPISVVPVPAWAMPYHLTAKPQDGYVLYESTMSLDLPSEPFDFTISVPKQVPYLSGEWGLKKVQVQTNLSASSATGPSNSKVSGNGALALAGKDLALTVPAASSYLRTDLQPEGLQLQAGQATFELPVTEYTKKLGLQDFIPGVSVLYQQPKIGAALQALDISLVSATIRNKLHGVGTLGVADNSIKFTGGTATDDVDMFLTAGPNFADTVFLLAVAGANASLTVDLALPPHAAGCQLNAYAYLLYGAFGHVGTFPDPVSSFNLFSCTDFAQHGNGGVLAAPARLPLAEEASLKIEPRSAGWQPERSVEQPVAAGNEQGAESAALVENASALWSSPALAAGPGGRLALAWVSELADRERPEAWQARMRMFDGKRWGQPVILSDNALPGYNPTVAFDGSGQVVTAWVQTAGAGAKKVMPLQELISTTEIVYTVTDPAGNIKSRGSLTGDTALDFSPQLAAGADGTVWLAWESSHTGDFLPANGAPNTLKVARWNGKEWSKIEQASDQLGGVVSWQMAAFDASTALVVAVARGDSSYKVIAFEYRGGQWQARRELAGNLLGSVACRAAYSANGKPVVGWSSDDGIAGLIDDLAVTPSSWITEPVALSNIATGSSGDMLLVFAGSESGARNIRTAEYDPISRRWSASSSIYTGQAGLPMSLPRAVTNSNGDLALVLTAPVTGSARSMQAQSETPLATPSPLLAELPELANIVVVRKPGVVSAPDKAAPLSSGNPMDTGWLVGGAALIAALVVATLIVRRNRLVRA